MKMFVVIFICLLVGGIDANQDVNIKVEVCEPASMCDCKPARKATAENLKYNDELGCFCSCGSEVDEDCLVDADCVHGLHCGAGNTVSGMGQCKDACKKPGFECGIFDYCVIDSTGDAECKCDTRACSDMLIGSGVCTIDPLDNNAKQTFNNDCLYVNEQCIRRQDGKNKLERHPVSKCAVEIEPRIGNPGLLGGWRMAGI